LHLKIVFLPNFRKSKLISPLLRNDYSEVNILKEWRCIESGHHENVGKDIEEWEKAGWHLHTYSTAGLGAGWERSVKHYLLWVRGE
jgi:hypothetical protein